MIDVAFTYADVRPARVAVVIDVLRATSTNLTTEFAYNLIALLEARSAAPPSL